MWEKIRTIFTIPELRQKILLTCGLLAVYRVGWQITLPLVNATAMSAYFKSQGGGLGQIFQQVAMFSASQLSQATIFGLGIMPYISASIIFQLLGSVYAPLEKLQKEGESGRKRSTNTPATPPSCCASARAGSTSTFWSRSRISFTPAFWKTATCR